MADKFIKIRGAREHNLKGVNVDIPRDRLTVLTGLSGSGKSSLAFDTIYAEGQRRYMESLSSYARQFLGQMEKPRVEMIEGLPPAISIDQKSTNRNPRSTVGTVTEIYDYLRLLYARIGIPHCPKCGREIRRQTVDEMTAQVMSLPERTKIVLLAPVVRGKKGEHQKVLETAKKGGYVRLRVDGIDYETQEEIKLDKNVKHTIEIMVDRLIVKPGIESRLAGSIENVMDLADGLCEVEILDRNETWTFSQNFACPDCMVSVEEVEPRSFSFNNPFGACPECLGLGYRMKFDLDLIIPDRTKSIAEGCIVVGGWQNVSDKDSFGNAMLQGLCKKYGFNLTTPFRDYPENIKDLLLYGTPEPFTFSHKGRSGDAVYNRPFPGIMNVIEQRYREAYSESQKLEYENYMRVSPCTVCNGKRLKQSSLAVTVGGMNIYDFTNLPVRDMLTAMDGWELGEMHRKIAEEVLKEVRARLCFLRDVGLDYLSLTRQASTLSGGESQRIRLATQIGSGLVGVAYILDEPSIGLHQKDNDKLLRTLKSLRDVGNTVIVVEHDEDTMREADYLVDMGPGAGEHGGTVVAAGTVEDVIKNPNSLTGRYLAGKEKIDVPLCRRKPTGFITVKGAREHNLKNIDVQIPLGVFTCVTGVSGSGKSSLVDEILTKSLEATLNGARTYPGDHDEILGTEKLDKIISIDQSPIGRTPRSNPVTYTGAFDFIREIFAKTKDAKARGYEKGRFSFNVKGGRCEACGGDGIRKIEMNFLPDVYVPCEICHGSRYNRETLDCYYKGKNIADVLEMTVEEALEFFDTIPKIRTKIQALHDVGLDYVKLGQPSTELSGGEAQRVKLATELSRRATGRTLYVLDEPTTGLHFHDVKKLVEILERLTEGGNTVVVIEHNLDVIKCADYIIDMGPDGGDKGGTVVVQGTPEEVVKSKKGYTAEYVGRYLRKE